MSWQAIDNEVKSWLKQARKLILTKMDSDLQVSTKSGPNDLVTNLDKQVEQFYISQIKQKFKHSRILGEESCKEEGLLSFDGLFWVIDPIDGTMNFVKEKENFASMIAIYKQGKPYMSYIYDVMKDRLVWGGPALGAVYCNQTQLPAPKQHALKDGLVAISCPMVLANYRNVVEVIKASSGCRMVGSAGIEFINLILGKHCAYLSYLRPWDFLPGKILGETLGLSVKTIDDEKVDVVSSSVVLVATKSAHTRIIELVNR